MQNTLSSHGYGCSTSQEIPCLSENLRGDDNYKTLHTKMWTQYSMYQYTNKVVCVLCWRLRCSQAPSTHSYHKPNKKNPILLSITFKHQHYFILPSLPSGSSCTGFLSKLCIPFFFTICMLHATYVLSSLLRLC